MAPPGDSSSRVVVGPGRPGQVEQPPPFLEADLRIGVRIAEDMQVVEGADQLGMPRQQHAVAEHVARHVADADAGEILGLAVDPDLAEVPLDRFPGAARRDAHLLVVVAARSARREGVAQPEPVILRHAVGDIGERRRALVRRDHQIGIVAVQPHDARRRHHRAVGRVVVGDVEQAAHQRLVALDHFGHQRVAPGIGRRRALDHEAALRPDRHDHGVLDHLRLHQAQDLGAEVLAPVGPADAAARHLAAAQMDRLGARAVDPDLDQRPRQRQLIDRAAVQLHRQVGLQLPVGAFLEIVGPQGRADEVEEPAQDAVLVQVGDVVQRVVDLHQQPVDRDLDIVGDAAGARLRRIVHRLEQPDDQPGDAGMIGQRVFHIVLAELEADLAQVLGIGPQHRDFAPAQPRPQHQPVEAVVLHPAFPDPQEAVLEGLPDAAQVDGGAVLRAHREVVDPDRLDPCRGWSPRTARPRRSP